MIGANDSGIESVGLSEEDKKMFLNAIGRVPTSYEIAMLSFGANPFTKSESKQILSYNPKGELEKQSIWKLFVKSTRKWFRS